MSAARVDHLGVVRQLLAHPGVDVNITHKVRVPVRFWCCNSGRSS
jgi:hypothetical protein